MTGSIVGIGLGLIILGLGLGIGSVGKAALDAMARQPELYGKLQSTMLIAAGIIEGTALFAIVGALFLAK